MTEAGAPGRKRVRAALAAAGILASPADAGAHLVNTGLGPVYDGVAHFAMSPEVILPIIALGILAGLRGLAHARASVVILPTAWVVFGFVGMLLGPLAVSPAYESLPLLMLGGLVATDIRMPAWCLALLAILFGAFEGYNFGSAYFAIGDGPAAVIGSAGLVFVLITLVSAAILKAKWNWTRIAMRVVGSWTAASGMLLLGWGLR
ncbi:MULTISPECIES: HupE/UreJ family protein [unclassified Rhizobium]|uniref:HupE/UreJ family protein n=1 Tax=unclassified Rhizobium TaxID=2613769 RepID=UPI0007EAD42A|nr:MULTISPECIES: HupE/UreJ family protein [unclassified Rhizobium]ANM14711.1 HupE/UreJ protein [Rhizobium sp. N324]ANM21100.1 HupE/UreJ protein [Rhizobium sp. N541]ANM27471.1 HupE/UreJ protein [Rhizobium sp. N941]OYC99814.1 HupE/UreJ protein [Rhizobium sp. N4311]